MEVMLVLSIVGILSAVGVSQLAPRSASAVRTLMDEVEGSLGNAHRAAAATGRDTAIVTWGTWAEGTLCMAHGDATLSDRKIQKLAIGATPSGSTLSAAQISAAQASSVATAFRCLPGDRAQAGARIVALGSSQWTNAMQAFNGRQNVKITDVQPFADASSAGGATGLMNGLVVDGNRLFPEAADPHRVVVNGSSKRFMSSFIIPIVGTTSSGGAVPGAPMGLIVVLDNGASIFKFYNPGARDGDGAWRRI
jgi:type II secretory pathway pseudopilin PulG